MVAKSAIKTVPARDPAREALAEAIENASSLRAKLSAATTAVANAKRRRYLADERLEEFNNKKSEFDPGARFLAALASGETCDVADLAAGEAENDRMKAALEQEISTWAKTIASCARVVADLQDQLKLAEFGVNRCVDDVLKSAGASIVAEAVELAERLRDELIKHRAILRFFDHGRTIADEQMSKRVRTVLTFREFPTVMEFEMATASYKHHPISLALGTAREALKIDAEAPLPEFK